MGWEKRARGACYYTRSHREAGRVVREYLGCGELALLAAAQDEAGREGRAAERADRARDRGEASASTSALTALGRELDDLVRSALERAGYHEHRGEWRQKRRP